MKKMYIGLMAIAIIGLLFVSGCTTTPTIKTNEPTSLSEYRTKILNWGTIEGLQCTYWELMSNPSANYVSVGDRCGSYIEIVKKNCKNEISLMVNSKDIIFKENKDGIAIYEGYQPHLEYSTATKESEFFCSGNNQFVIMIRPKNSPILDKYFEEFI